MLQLTVLNLSQDNYNNNATVSGYGHPNDRLYINDSSDTSIPNYWTRDTPLINVDGSRVYTRERVHTPPPHVEEMFHRVKPINVVHHQMKRQISDQRRFDPKRFQKAMDLQKAKRNSSTAEVRSAAELKVLLHERCSVRLAERRPKAPNSVASPAPTPVVTPVQADANTGANTDATVDVNATVNDGQ